MHASLDKTALPSEVGALVGEKGATDVALGVVSDHIYRLDGVLGVRVGLSMVLLKNLLSVLVGRGRRLATGPSFQAGSSFGGCSPHALEGSTEASLGQTWDGMRCSPLL